MRVIIAILIHLYWALAAKLTTSYEKQRRKGVLDWVPSLNFFLFLVFLHFSSISFFLHVQPTFSRPNKPEVQSKDTIQITRKLPLLYTFFSGIPGMPALFQVPSSICNAFNKRLFLSD